MVGQARVLGVWGFAGSRSRLIRFGPAVFGRLSAKVEVRRARVVRRVFGKCILE